jgi:hypothetical protein
VLSPPELTCVVIGAAEPEHLTSALAVVDDPQPAPEGNALLEGLKASPLFQAFEARRRREFLERARPTRI